MVLELTLGPEAESFREEVRTWLGENARHAPDDPDGMLVLLRSSVLDDWADRMTEAGYMCVSWPREFGGRGLSGVEVAVLNEEFARAGVPRVTRGMAENIVGPAIIVHGTAEQKQRLLPRIISGADRYCQGFSEPEAGSDLAGLKTRGVVDGDEVVVTGQKVWTSWYQQATMLFCLCRTDPDVPKHQGITYVLIPVRTEGGDPNGIDFRPLRQITGDSHFAETFIDEARAPLSNVIGGLNNGWRVAMTTLGNERGGTATTQHVQFAREFWKLVEDVRRWGLNEDPLVRQQLAWAYSHVEIMRYQGLRILSALATNRDPGPSGSINKVFWSEYQRRLGEIAVGLEGASAMVVSNEYARGRWQRTFLQTRGHTIWGGTAEIQRNILGEKILGLPKEPKAPA